MFSLETNPLDTCLTLDGLKSHGTECLETAAQKRAELKALSQQASESLTWGNTFGTLEQITGALTGIGNVANLLAVTHPDKAIRDFAETWEPQISKFVTDFFLDAELAEVFTRAADRLKYLDEAKQIFVQDTLREYKRNGLHLPPEGQTRLRAINEEITKLGQEFERNIATTTLSIQADPQDLAGLPETYIASHPPQADGKILITTNTPDYLPFMKYTKNRALARELYTLHKNRAKEQNLPILKKILALRYEKAKLLGYQTWADFVIEPRMAKNQATVAAFLKELHTGIQVGIEADIQILREVAKDLGWEVSDKISIVDVSYLEEIACRERFALDSQKLNEYFEFNATLQGFMHVAEQLFGISFRDVDAPTWHPDVRPLEILDRDGSVLGRLYLDLYPRENKYKHFAEFPIRTTQKLADGSRLIPIAALVCNFAKPGKTPSLLTHRDVTTLFHEFGHALHELLSQAELMNQGGTKVAWDFVETPSQLLEEFAWTYETLRLFAKHYQTGEVLPEELHQAMLRARGFGEAYDTAQQLFYAALDQEYHTREPNYDTTELMQELFRSYIPFEAVPDTHFQASFGHLIGYDAGYYSYQWALAIARDLLTRFQNEGMLNPKTSSDYRKCILEPGGSMEETKMVENFLGRPFNLEAYKKFLGVS
jgi:thimet oligopeptidase